MAGACAGAAILAAIILWLSKLSPDKPPLYETDLRLFSSGYCCLSRQARAEALRTGPRRDVSPDTLMCIPNEVVESIMRRVVEKHDCGIACLEVVLCASIAEKRF